MSINCPKCSKLILPWKLKQECYCSNCQTPLKAKNTNIVFVVSLVAWSLAEIAIKNFMWTQFGDSTLSFILSMTVSAATGLAIYFTLTKFFTPVEIVPAKIQQT